MPVKYLFMFTRNLTWCFYWRHIIFFSILVWTCLLYQKWDVPYVYFLHLVSYTFLYNIFNLSQKCICWTYPGCIILEIQKIQYYLNYNLWLMFHDFQVMFHKCLRSGNKTFLIAGFSLLSHGLSQLLILWPY